MASLGSITNLDTIWRFDKLRNLGSRLSSALKGLNLGSRLSGFSKWLSGLSWSGIAKGGLGAAIVGGIYSTWNSLVGSVSDVTGLPEETTEDLLFIGLALFALYVIYKLVSTRKGRQLYNDYNETRYYRNRAKAERNRAKYYSQKRSETQYRTPRNTGSYSSSGVRQPVNRPDLRTYPVNRPDMRQKNKGRGSR